ncbi:CobW family GTP-binding protein [Pelagibacterium lentulum]|uniref:CobW C-terminal domain-containing protein n=1 Tax=Pelagibacterium lentulum TaxID=2029865 RepID=A0A916RES8_9HYPH|nr:GTP-binding protein [Pelagibacterium lentulum]GGA53832.1 hypothetical protein GCM10011499_24910 [Pelagibacterium lentulum]
MSHTLPVTLLTGFLGSGKTTLLNRMLADPGMQKAAVVVNEFGSVAIDNDLVHKGTERYFLTTTGCLCCNATSDIRTSLYELNDMVVAQAVPRFDRVVIETTGLADPAPIVNSLIPGGAPALGLRDHVVARRFHLSRIVATLDTELGPKTLDSYVEARKQLAFANDIVMTKGDLMPDAVEQSCARAVELNPHAHLHDANQPGFAVASLIGSSSVSYAPTERIEDVARWLSGEGHTHHSHHGHHHDHKHDHDSPNRHGAVSALHLSADQPLDPKAVDAFLSAMTGQRHAGLLRMKGLLALADDPSRPMVVHAVQHRLYSPFRLEGWPNSDNRSRLMLIGADMPAEPIRRYFASLVKRNRPWWRGAI